MSRPCRCGHDISVHGDRALPPACEGNWPEGKPRMGDLQGPWVRAGVPACDCLGYTPC